MDFLFEWLIQLVIELFGQLLAEIILEALFRGIANALTSRAGRYIFGIALGFAFGGIWGAHLSGNAHWPRLLWVSVALGAVAGTMAVRRAVREGWRHPDYSRGWRALFVLPWRWSADRLAGFTFINVGLALGIVTTFRPS
jgi:hypothetical protein